MLPSVKSGAPVRALVVDDEPLPRERIVTLASAQAGVQVIGECATGVDAVAAIRRERPDLVFLDVQMPELDGFQVITAIAEDAGEAPLPAVIFVTAYDEYAIRAFDVDAVDYLLKPVSPDRFALALRRVLARLADRPARDDHRLLDFVERMRREREYLTRFVVRHGTRSAFVPVTDVDWMDVVSNYVRLHVGGKAHLIRETLRSVEEQLDPRRFLRVHRSIIINIDRIREIESHAHGEYRVTMADGARLQTSRTHSEGLRGMLK